MTDDRDPLDELLDEPFEPLPIPTIDELLAEAKKLRAEADNLSNSAHSLAYGLTRIIEERELEKARKSLGKG